MIEATPFPSTRARHRLEASAANGMIKDITHHRIEAHPFGSTSSAAAYRRKSYDIFGLGLFVCRALFSL